jgi:GNAT superfamily N-acetyltransferase
MKDFAGSGHFVALVDGEVVGSAGAGYTDAGVYLMGGNVAEHARGRGVYRALVRARWDEAVRRGTPALVVQAGQMSGPILRGIGFRPVCEMRSLIDSTT